MQPSATSSAEGQSQALMTTSPIRVLYLLRAIHNVGHSRGCTDQPGELSTPVCLPRVLFPPLCAGIQLARRQCGPLPNSRVLEPKGLSSNPILTPAVQKGTHAVGLRLPSSGRPAPDAGPWLVSGSSDFRGFPPSPDK